MQWRAWLHQHAPALIGQVGLDDVERVEDGYQIKRQVAEETYWRFPGLTPRTYGSAGWQVVDGEGQLASYLTRRWARLAPRSPAQATLVLRVLAEIEAVVGERLGEVPVRRWFLVEEDRLDEDALAAFCAALDTFKARVGQTPESSVYNTLWDLSSPTGIIHQATALLAPLHAEGRAVPDMLASWYLIQLVHPARPGAAEQPALERQEETRASLQHLTDLLGTFAQMAWGQWPVGLEAEVSRAIFPGDVVACLHGLVTDTLPAFLRASGGQRLPLGLLDVLPAPLDPEPVRALAAVFSWGAWKRLLEQFQRDRDFRLERPPAWVTLDACKLLITFGRRALDWLRACQDKRGWSCHEAAHWLPLTPAPGLCDWLMAHVETAQDRLAWVATQWNAPGFPWQGTLAQMRCWHLEELLRTAGTAVPETVLEGLKSLLAYDDLDPTTVCAAVQAVLPALRGEIPIDPRLGGRWDVGEGRVLRFLDKTDPLGLALGQATNCCQEWGGVGQACTEAGYLRPDSAFLMLEQGTRVLAQSWAWIGEGAGEAALVLDNIEIPCGTSLRGNDVLKLVQCWAETYREQQGIGVKLGAGSADYQLSCLTRAPASRLDGYAGYSDAERQLWLALPPLLAHLPAGVRLATWLDTDALNALERQIFPSALQTGVEVPSGEYGFALIYEEAGQPQGYLVVHLGYDWQDTHEGYVYDLAVLPAARRRAVWPLAEALHCCAAYFGLTALGAHLREHTSYRLLKRHGERLGFVLVEEDGWDVRADDERFMKARLRIVPRAE